MASSCSTGRTGNSLQTLATLALLSESWVRLASSKSSLTFDPFHFSHLQVGLLIVLPEIVLTVLPCTVFCTIFYLSSAADTVLDNEVTGLQFVTGNLANVIFDSIAWSRPGQPGEPSCQGSRWWPLPSPPTPPLWSRWPVVLTQQTPSMCSRQMFKVLLILSFIVFISGSPQ